jgi:hypothetical protein
MLATIASVAKSDKSACLVILLPFAFWAVVKI